MLGLALIVGAGLVLGSLFLKTGDDSASVSLLLCSEPIKLNPLNAKQKSPTFKLHLNFRAPFNTPTFHIPGMTDFEMVTVFCSLQCGSEIQTSLDFGSKRGWVANGPDFKCDLKFGSPNI